MYLETDGTSIPSALAGIDSSCHIFSESAKGSFSTWVTAIARNTALDLKKKRKDADSYEELSTEIPSDARGPEEEALRKETQSAVRSAIAKLSAFDQQLALDAGIGARFDFKVAIIRLDLAMPLRYPYPDSQGNHWNLKSMGILDLHPVLNIGYPF